MGHLVVSKAPISNNFIESLQPLIDLAAQNSHFFKWRREVLQTISAKYDN
jgi:hypothetical protein